MKPLLNFPKFLFTILVGLCQQFLVNVEVFFLVILSVFLGFVYSPSTGVIVFLSTYIVSRTLANFVLLIAKQLSALAAVISEHGRIQ